MEDVAITFGTIVGADPADPLTTRYIPEAKVPSNYTQFLNANGLQVNLQVLAADPRAHFDNFLVSACCRKQGSIPVHRSG